jgi:large subunit ribosomal protein L32
MGVPADKTTKSKRDMRRSHLALKIPNSSTCPNCSELKHSHRVCEHCGYYNGREVIKAKDQAQPQS